MLAQDPSPILRRCQTLPVDKWASQSLLCAGMVSPTVCVTLALLACTHAAVLEVGKQRIGRKTHERQYASTSSIQRQRHAKQFVYVYDMPAKFTTDIAKLSPEWHSEQYDYDQVRHCARTEQFPISAPISMQARDVARHAAPDSHLRIESSTCNTSKPGRPHNVLMQPRSIGGVVWQATVTCTVLAFA